MVMIENHNEEKLIKYITVKEMIDGIAFAFQGCYKTLF